LSTNLRSPVFYLYNQLGNLLREERLAYGITELETGALPPGMYFWVVKTNGRLVKSGKIVKSGR
jgi:hypothetical protein